MTRLLTVLVLVCLLLADVVADTPPITISVFPRVQMSAGLSGVASVRVSVTIPRNAQNRRIAVFIDGEMYRSWEQDHVGVGAPSRQEWTIRDLPAGEYSAVGVLVRVEEGGRVRQFTDSTLFEIR